jgi:predicted RNase H-like HicB family nuclease
MLIEYIHKALALAVYDKLSDGSFSGKISQCPGVIAFGETLSECQQELQDAIEGWLIVKIRHGDTLPVISRINLNKSIPASHKAAAHG